MMDGTGFEVLLEIAWPDAWRSFTDHHHREFAISDEPVNLANRNVQQLRRLREGEEGLNWAAPDDIHGDLSLGFRLRFESSFSALASNCLS